MNVFVLDNYDSFTYNLVSYLAELGASAVVVERNDVVGIDEIAARSPDAVVISPGPGAPPDAGVALALVEWCVRSQTPLFGVCLGHQAIGQALGGRVVPAPDVMHGKTSFVSHSGHVLFRGLPDPFEAMRYHSLVLERTSLPPTLEVIAQSSDGLVMGVAHRTLPVFGVQFHPESVLTACGKRIVGNFLVARRATNSSRR